MCDGGRVTATAPHMEDGTRSCLRLHTSPSHLLRQLTRWRWGSVYVKQLPCATGARLHIPPRRCAVLTGRYTARRWTSAGGLTTAYLREGCAVGGARLPHWCIRPTTQRHKYTDINTRRSTTCRQHTSPSETCRVSRKICRSKTIIRGNSAPRRVQLGRVRTTPPMGELAVHAHLFELTWTHPTSPRMAMNATTYTAGCAVDTLSERGLYYVGYWWQARRHEDCTEIAQGTTEYTHNRCRD